MCTLIVLDRIVPGAPLVAASNRDEFFARPAAPPSRVESRDGRSAFVAPQDLEAGGTWMGVNAAGMFVGLTNRPVEVRREGLRSRGFLVQDALAMRSAEDVEAWLAAGLSDEYNPFHLLAADGRSACLATSDLGRWDVESLDPDVHVVCNRDRSDTASSKISKIECDVQEMDLERGISTVLDQLRVVLSVHDADDPLEGACVHTPGYGTRSSSLVAFEDDRWTYWYADGAPCDTKYTNLTRRLDEIRSGQSLSTHPLGEHR